MDPLSATGAYDACRTNQPLQRTPSAQQAEPTITVPRITTRAGNTPAHETAHACASDGLQMSPLQRSSLVARIGDGNVAPEYAAPANADAGPGPAIEIMALDKLSMHLSMNELPKHFSVPYAPMPHLVLFGNALVSLENARPDQLAHLLHHVTWDEATSETLGFSCAQHLLALGADANLHTCDGGGWQAPLHRAQSIGSPKLINLLLEHGARPD